MNHISPGPRPPTPAELRHPLGALLVAFAVMCIALAGCSMDAPGPSANGSIEAPPSPDPSTTYETQQYFEGLEEWIVIHKGPGGVYCQRADGRRQDCEAVKAEDRAAAYEKWGAMMKHFGIKVMAAAPDESFDAHVMFAVDQPAGMNASDEAIRDAARETFFAAVLAGADRWQRLVEQAGGTVLAPAVRSMPEFTMRGPAKLYRELAWTTGIVRISERGKVTGGFAD